MTFPPPRRFVKTNVNYDDTMIRPLLINVMQVCERLWYHLMSCFQVGFFIFKVLGHSFVVKGFLFKPPPTLAPLSLDTCVLWSPE